MKVGEIQGYPVVYIPEKDSIFCKNTIVKYPIIERIILSSHEKEEIPEKNLTIQKEKNIVHLGCLTTSKSNLLAIKRQVYKFKNNK